MKIPRIAILQPLKGPCCISVEKRNEIINNLSKGVIFVEVMGGDETNFSSIQT
jgi:hypothetical protein